MANEVMAVEKTQRKKRPKSKTRNQDQDEVPLPIDDTAREKTKAVFLQLQDAYLQQEAESKAKGKRKKRTDQQILDNLRKGQGIQKDEDRLLQANMYDPDDIKSRKSNKRNQRDREEELDIKSVEEIPVPGLENLGYDDSDKIPSTRRGKKKVNKNITAEISDREMTISELAAPPKEETGYAETSFSTPVAPTRKKKKKKPKSAIQDTEEENLVRETFSGEGETGDDLDNSRDELVPSSDMDAQQTRVKKKKKKKKQTEEPALAEAYAHALEEADESTLPEATPTPRVVADDGRVVGITIHRTDKLKTDFFIAHPLVRVHVIDLDTGNYLKKQTKDRPVTSFFETQNEKVDFILPIMTQPFDFKQKKSTLPVWEELLVFNENFNYFIQENPRVMFFFEVLDFVSMTTASQQYNDTKQEGGWHRIGWAFLKVLGAHRKPNTDKKVRLQIYQPPVRFKTKGNQLEVYQWWQSAQRVALATTLYVTVKGIIPPRKIEPAARSMFAIQEEKGKITYDDLQKSLETGASVGRTQTKRRGPSLWARLTGQLCRVPNKMCVSLPAGKQGCFILQFSDDGKTLACGCHDKDGYPILLYEIPSGKLKGQILGHFSLIYDLSWTADDNSLLSASADGTARVWDAEKISNTPLKTLPHPAFVYAAKFHPRVNNVVVTGGYDRVVRVWSIHGDDQHGQLMQELDGHKGFVNSLCFDQEGVSMYTADSLGQISIWNAYVTDQPSKKGHLRDWTLNKVVDDAELKGKCINCIKLHPNGRKLLVHSRENVLHMLDLRVYSLVQHYHGALNFREHVRSTITPCGSFVVSGSEDACCYIWNSESGDQVAMYADLGYNRPVCDVDFHPHDHFLAVCAYGENHPVIVYKYDSGVAQQDAGLNPLTQHGVSSKKDTTQTSVAQTTKTDTERVTTTPEDFRTQGVARLQRAQQKLQSVTTFLQSSQQPTSAGMQHPLATQPSIPSTGFSTWGSTFDNTVASRAYKNMAERGISAEPSAFSPHASRNMSQSAQQRHFAAQSQYMKDGVWRPGFSAVGRQSGQHTGGHSYHGRTPQIGLSTASGKPQFSFQSTSAKSINGELVYALYDYQPQRSDELQLVRGDIITVLYKDNDNWWMGELADGKQGFFPVNYISSYSDIDGEDLNDDYKVQIDPQDDDEDDNKTVTAVRTKSGDLKFISANEDSDAEIAERRKKKTRKPKTTHVTIETEVHNPPRQGRKKRSELSQNGESIA